MDASAQAALPPERRAQDGCAVGSLHVSMHALRVIVTGLIAQHPLLGGITWHYLQYVLGFLGLGHDVYYVEDSGEWPYDLSPEGGRSGWVARGCEANVTYLAGVMADFGLTDKWLYRSPIDSSSFGMGEDRFAELLRTADVLVNVSGTLARPEWYREIPALFYVDTDPVFTQIALAEEQSS